MEGTYACAICHVPDVEDRLVGWYIGSERRWVHDDCWLRVHRSAAATANQPAA